MENTRPPQGSDSLFSIRVNGLTNDVQKEDLNKMFEGYGQIGDVYIPRNIREGGNRGFGFVRFTNEDDAREALKEDGKELLGATISVSMAEARPPRRESRRSDRYDDDYYRRRSYSRGRSSDRHRHHSRSRSRSRSRSHHHRDRSHSYSRHSTSHRDSRSRRYGSRSASRS